MKRIVCISLIILMLPVYLLACESKGVEVHTPKTTVSGGENIPVPDTTVGEDTTFADTESSIDTTVIPETTAVPETTSAPETTAKVEVVDPPKSEYISLKGELNNAVMVTWPYSEKEFNVLASYSGTSDTNIQALAATLYTKLRSAPGASVVLSNDNGIGIFKEEWCEVLVGATDRDATRKVKAELAIDEFAVKVVGNDVVVTGFSYLATKMAVYKFIDILATYKDTSSGTEVYRIPSDFSYVGKISGYSTWNFDIPEYPGGALDSVTPADNNSYVMVYADTTKNEYIGYTSMLERAGYKKYFHNNMAGNLYTVMQNEKSVINAYYLPYSNSAYIVVEDADKVTLPSLENEYVDKGYRSSITQMKLNNVLDSNGQCHVFRLSDGRFIIVDGGGNDTRDGRDDADNLYTLLCRLSEGQKPVIAAWFITHLHGDHYAVLRDFGSNFTDKVEVQNFIYNFPSSETVDGNTDTTRNNVIASMNAFAEAKHITAHTGQKFSFANADIEMLYAPEMLCPNYITFYNDSSLVFTVTVDGTKTLITGDASPNTSNMMCKMYGAYLQCDILQISHHGSYGCSVDYYRYTNPKKLALLPVGATQQIRLTAEKENVFVAGLVTIYPHFEGTRTFYLPMN